MRKSPTWQYNEFKQVGTDYDDPREVEAYDSRHAQFRDIDAECNDVLDTLGVTSKSTVIELGTGTGAFAIHAARRCDRVYAVDVSVPMLEFARKKAEAVGVANIIFRHGGFLTYDHEDNPADALVSCMAFHHLPDFWKSIALVRMNDMLRDGGQLYINDVIYSDADALANISRWIDELGKIGGTQLSDEVATHVREEFSTLDWIMEGLLTRAGFNIQSKEVVQGVVGHYLCVKAFDVARQRHALSDK